MTDYPDPPVVDESATIPPPPPTLPPPPVAPRWARTVARTVAGALVADSLLYAIGACWEAQRSAERETFVPETMIVLLDLAAEYVAQKRRGEVRG